MGHYVGTNNKLNGCINDINAVGAWLKQNGAKAEDIIKLADDRGTNPDIEDIPTNASPTGQNVLDNLKKLARESKPGDIIFFHYSGHGSQLPDQPPSDPHHDEPIPFGEMEGKDDCLCTLPVNAYSNWVRDDFLKEALALAPEGVLFVNNHDACHNGTGEDLVNNSNQTQLSQQKETIKAGVVLISGCLDKQTSADAQTPKRVAEGAETYGYLTWTSSMGFRFYHQICYHWR